MKRLPYALLLFVFTLPLGCGSPPASAPLDDAAKAEIAEHDAAVDAAESAQQ
jgi:hypothetical protein